MNPRIEATRAVLALGRAGLLGLRLPGRPPADIARAMRDRWQMDARA